MSINKWVGIGRLTKDPELRYTPSGVAVSTFTLAVTRAHNREESDFINNVAWRQLAELTANYLKKGSQCAVEGRLQTRHYDNSEGKRVYVTEVVVDNVQFLDSKKSENNQSQNSSQPRYGFDNSDPFANESKTIDLSDDDLPF